MYSPHRRFISSCQGFGLWSLQVYSLSISCGKDCQSNQYTLPADRSRMLQGTPGFKLKWNWRLCVSLLLWVLYCKQPAVHPFLDQFKLKESSQVLGTYMNNCVQLNHRYTESKPLGPFSSVLSTLSGGSSSGAQTEVSPNSTWRDLLHAKHMLYSWAVAPPLRPSTLCLHHLQFGWW